jgi:serine-type D-Ala-D-Ala carboxypeptidase
VTFSREALSELAQSGVVGAGVAPSAALAIGARTEFGFRFASGAAGFRSALRPEPIDEETPFDLASLTKPFVAAAICRLIRRGALSWATPLSEVLPELSGTATECFPLLSLISHRAGLEGHRALYLDALSGRFVDPGEALIHAANARRAGCLGPIPDGGYPPVYSDLGYLLAGAVASRAGGGDLAAVVASEVTEPLGIDAAPASTWQHRLSNFLDRVAPTETVAWRGGEIVGSVHDENAWILSGLALSGHAGLFGTAGGVARFGAAMLDALAGRLPDWLRPEEASELVVPRSGGTLRAGFDGRADEGSSAGSHFGAKAFGHLGFTGTSLWCDPVADVVTVILTNRVSPSRENLAIRSARPVLNDALFRAAHLLKSAQIGGSGG